MSLLKSCIVLTVLLSLSAWRVASAQGAPSIVWQHAYGGTSDDDAAAITPTDDGGYVIVGATKSDDGDVTGRHGGWDYWVVRIDSKGSLQWQKTFGGTGDDKASAVAQTHDGGFVVAGYSGSSDGDIEQFHHGDDYWVVKLDRNGTLLWEQTYGGSDDDFATAILPTADGGFVVGGFTNSNDGQVKGHHGINNADYWVVKIDSIGTLMWARCYGGTASDKLNSIAPAADGGFVLAGMSLSHDGNVTGHHFPTDPNNPIDRPDFWITKIDAVGGLQWENSFGGDEDDEAYSVHLQQDSGFVVSGVTYSNNGDVFRGTVTATDADFWIVKLRANGTLQWQKTVGGSGDDMATSCVVTGDGECVVAGVTTSHDGPAADNHNTSGTTDYLVVKIDNAGNLQWGEAFGGSGNDAAFAIAEAAAGGYVVAGVATISDGEVTGTHDQATNDYWAVKILEPGAIIESRPDVHLHTLACKPTTVDTVWIHNFGGDTLTVSSAAMSGPNASQFSLLAPSAFPVVIASLDSFPFVVQVITSGTASPTATLALLSSDTVTSRNPWNIALIGNMDTIIPLFPAIIDVGSVRVDTTLDTSFVLRNRNSFPICISALPGQTDLSITSPTVPFTVAAGQSVTVTIHFAPTSTAASLINGFVGVDCPCPEQERLQLTGTGLQPLCASEATLTLPNIEANVGDHIEIPLTIAQSVNLNSPCGASTYAWSLRFRRSVLFPLDASLQSVDSGADRIISFSGTRTDTIGPMFVLHGVAALGDTDATPLHFESYTWTNGTVTTTFADGMLKLKNVCMQGGPRLINGNGTISLMPNNPNPFIEETLIPYEIIERGHTILRIVDIFGRTVAVLVDDDRAPGRYVASFHSQGLPSAMYVCELSTPTTHRRMSIIKQQ